MKEARTIKTNVAEDGNGGAREDGGYRVTKRKPRMSIVVALCLTGDEEDK